MSVLLAATSGFAVVLGASGCWAATGAADVEDFPLVVGSAPERLDGKAEEVDFSIPAFGAAAVRAGLLADGLR